MTFSEVSLESFENDETGQPIQSAEFSRGFAAGQAASMKEFEATKSDAIATIAASLADMSFGFTEARDYLLCGLRPLLTQLAETALPAILKDTFGAHLAQTVLDHFNTMSDAAIHISVSPDAIADLSEMETGGHVSQFVFVPNPDLLLGQAVLCQADKHLMIDLVALSDALQSALRGLESLERTLSNG